MVGLSVTAFIALSFLIIHSFGLDVAARLYCVLIAYLMEFCSPVSVLYGVFFRRALHIQHLKYFVLPSPSKIWPLLGLGAFPLPRNFQHVILIGTTAYPGTSLYL